MRSDSTIGIERSLRLLQEFLRLESAGGLVLMGAALLAMLVANSPLERLYGVLLELPLEFRIGSFGIAKPLLLWINDGLMAIFFLLVGLELKREVVQGHLSTLRGASLPAFAALGGLLVPAAIYAACNWNDATALKGWAIPSATDIAFALGVLSLLGDRVPPALKAFLLSIAIFDDLGAIVVIALFYTAKLSLTALTVALFLVAALFLLNRLGVTRPAAYLLLGIPLWVAVLKSGVHATLAGVAVAFCIPLGPTAAGASDSPLDRLEHLLHPWVAFGILPIFAFVNAGVSFSGLSLADLLHPVPLGIVAGLLVGKQLGVMAACGAAVRLRLATLPEGVRWSQLYGTSLLCGIGFTMSLFVASLAFEEGGYANVGLERLGIVAGSLIAGATGYLALRFALGPSTGKDGIAP
ncbi:Na+/H+ antiporter NhaA [Geomonas sp.]|uniref:Na+/H+ antiporter NhaA n=1 Tax=Geomonas sp. TaxID=2651584 RepID=UPI002B467F51|nr:Na+/H+ antiporter NhaA [Geomonas sp.]HJV35581.1 Na+/H+ antiporter NhaA [Geomonas sp.]